MQASSLIVCTYAALVGAGGLFGYARAKSVPSLLAGAFSCLLLLFAGRGLSKNKAWGLPLALGVSGLLLVFFGVRYAKAAPRAFLPSGLMAVLSFFALTGLALTKK